jgi:hypothetical protein
VVSRVFAKGPWRGAALARVPPPLRMSNQCVFGRKCRQQAAPGNGPDAGSRGKRAISQLIFCVHLRFCLGLRVSSTRVSQAAMAQPAAKSRDLRDTPSRAWIANPSMTVV